MTKYTADDIRIHDRICIRYPLTTSVTVMIIAFQRLSHVGVVPLHFGGKETATPQTRKMSTGDWGNTSVRLTENFIKLYKEMKMKQVHENKPEVVLHTTLDLDMLPEDLSVKVNIEILGNKMTVEEINLAFHAVVERQSMAAFADQKTRDALAKLGIVEDLPRLEKLAQALHGSGLINESKYQPKAYQTRWAGDADTSIAEEGLIGITTDDRTNIKSNWGAFDIDVHRQFEKGTPTTELDRTRLRIPPKGSSEDNPIEVDTDGYFDVGSIDVRSLIALLLSERLNTRVHDLIDAMIENSLLTCKIKDLSIPEQFVSRRTDMIEKLIKLGVLEYHRDSNEFAVMTQKFREFYKNYKQATHDLTSIQFPTW